MSTTEKKIQFLMEKGAFAIKPTQGPFAKSIGKTAEEEVASLKLLIDKYQNEIKEICENEFEHIPHSLQLYFEMIDPLILARDIKYLIERLEDESIDTSTLHMITVGYEKLIAKFEKKEVLNQVLDATKESNIHAVVGFRSSAKSVMKVVR